MQPKSDITATTPLNNRIKHQVVGPESGAGVICLFTICIFMKYKRNIYKIGNWNAVAENVSLHQRLINGRVHDLPVGICVCPIYLCRAVTFHHHPPPLSTIAFLLLFLLLRKFDRRFFSIVPIQFNWNWYCNSNSRIGIGNESVLWQSYFNICW